MKLFRTRYDDSYYSTVIKYWPFHKRDLINKKTLIRLYKAQGKLLEVGCAEGELLYLLQDEYNISGIDISQHSVDKTNQLIGKKIAKVLDIQTSTLKEKYDVILLFDVLEHLSNPQTVIKRLLYSLNENGILIFTVPNNYGIFGSLSTYVFNVLDRTHINAFKRERWIQVVQSLGLRYVVLNQTLINFTQVNWTKHIGFNLAVVILK